MTTYQHTPDGEDEPTLWFHRDSYPHWQPLLRRVDLPPDARGLWADVVAGVLSRSDGQARGVLGEHHMLPGSHERSTGAECACGKPWSVWGDRCCG